MQVGRLRRHLGIRGHLPRVTWALVSDHGGHGTGHGTGAPGDYAIPIVLSGTGVREDVDLPGRVSLLDVAPTLAKLLGVGLPDAPESGRVLARALVGVEGPPPRPRDAPARELWRRRAEEFGGPP